MFISSTLLRQGVCVYHLYRCKTSTLQGRVALMSYHTQRSCGHEWGETWPVSCTCYTILYIYIVPPLGAFKSQLGGHILYRCCFILSLTPVFILHIYIYKCIILFLSCWCFLHERYIPCQQFEKLFQASVSFLPARQDGRNPSGNAFPGSTSDIRLDL